MGSDEIYLDQEIFLKVTTENKDLAVTPKIFIIQACRGSEFHKDVHATDGDAKEALLPVIAKGELEAKQAIARRIPKGADVCVFYSTTPGYYSLRKGF